jgi:hypothetical protein
VSIHTWKQLFIQFTIVLNCALVQAFIAKWEMHVENREYYLFLISIPHICAKMRLYHADIARYVDENSVIIIEYKNLEYIATISQTWIPSIRRLSGSE